MKKYISIAAVALTGVMAVSCSGNKEKTDNAADKAADLRDKAVEKGAELKEKAAEKGKKM